MTKQLTFLRPLHVVHIDDNATGRNVVKAVLDESSYPSFVVHSFVSIEEAKAWLGANLQQIDCVLLDLMLAESEGADTFSRAVTVFSSVPVIVITGIEDVDLACQLVSHGADNYLHKSLVTKHLSIFIGTAIARRYRPVIPPHDVLETLINDTMPPAQPSDAAEQLPTPAET